LILPWISLEYPIVLNGKGYIRVLIGTG